MGFRASDSSECSPYGHAGIMGLGKEVFGLLQTTRPMFCPKALTVRTLRLDVRAAGSAPLPAMSHSTTDGPEIKNSKKLAKGGT